MTQIWAYAVVVFLVGASAACAMWAVLRARDITQLHNGLVAALRDHGVLRMSMAEEAGTRGTTYPNAEVTGPQDTVKDWLTHYAVKRNPDGTHVTWPQVVAEFYNRAADDPEVASYFFKTDIRRLRPHMAKAMVHVTRDGVAPETLAAMARAHAGVTNERGVPITGRIYDKVIAVLGQVLAEHGVSQPAIEQLATTVAPLRAAIVVEA